MKYFLTFVFSFQSFLSFAYASPSLNDLISKLDKKETIILNDSAIVEITKPFYFAKNGQDSLLKKALNFEQLCIAVNYRAGLALSLLMQAYYYSATKQISTAQEKFVQLINRFPEEKYLVAKAQNGLATILVHQEKYEEALRLYFTALEYYIGNGKKASQAAVYNELGIIYKRQKKLPLAKDYYMKALHISIESGDEVMQGKLFNNLAFIERDQKNYAKAEQYLLRSMELKKKQGDLLGLGHSLNNLGNLEVVRQNYTKALDYHLQSFEIKKQLNDPAARAQGHSSLGATYMYLRNYDKSIFHNQKAIELSHLLKIKSIAMDSYGYLAKCFEGKKDFRKAYEYQQLFQATHDSIFSEESDKRIHELQVKFEAAQKEAEIRFLKEEQQKRAAELKFQEILTKSTIIGLCLVSGICIMAIVGFRNKKRSMAKLQEKQSEIQAKNAELSRLYQELSAKSDKIKFQKDKLEELNAIKDKIFGIISHDLRVPLHNVQLLIEMVLHEHVSVNEFHKLVENLDKQFKGSFFMIENLLIWASGQMNGFLVSKEEFGIYHIVGEMIDIFSDAASKKGITIQNRISEKCMVAADREMTKLVIRNLIANAVKFTKPKGKIVISAAETENIVTFSIKDNGVGMSEQQVKSLFTPHASTTYGTENEKGTGIGLLLCKDFIEKNNGKIWVESKPGKGSKFNFTLSSAHKVLETAIE